MAIIIEHRMINIVERAKCMLYSKKDYVQRTNVSRKRTIGFPPTAIIDVSTHFTARQLELLNRGPAYIPLCQTYLSLSSDAQCQQMIKEQFEPLRQELSSFFIGNHVSLVRVREFFNDLQAMIQNIYSQPLAPNIQLRAQDDKRVIRSLRGKMKKENIVIRPTDKSNRFYLGHLYDFKRKGLEYMAKTDAYQLVQEINQVTILFGVSADLKVLLDIIGCVDSTLRDLFQHQRITSSQFNAMRVDRTNVELVHLY